MKQCKCLILALILLLGGCVVKKPRQSAAAIPPPPAPVVQQPPAPPPEPLSIPQTHAELPPPQQISPEALATIVTKEQPVDAAPATPRTTRRPIGPVAGPKPEQPSAAPTGAAQTPVVPAPAEAELRGPVQEIVPASELKRLQDSFNARAAEIRKFLEQVKDRKLTNEQKAVVGRIQSFLQQSEDAEKRGDLRQADALAERAQVLAKELQSASR